MEQSHSQIRRLLAELKGANEQLEAKNVRLAELYDTAQQFVDNVSEEFRTPLTVIMEFTSILRDGLAGQINAAQREYLDIIADRVEDLSLMASDMIDVSRVEAGLLSVIRRAVRVQEVIERVRPVLERRAAAHKVKLDIEPLGDTPEVFCDGEKIGRVIVNLVAGAIKFSSEGDRVRLWARTDDQGGEVTIGVSDQGPGIAAESLQTLSERFRQTEGSARPPVKGCGMGLEIARQLVRLNLGEINVESQPGEGSTFSFTVPLARPESLIARYLKCCERNVRQASAISLLTATPASPVDAITAEQTDDFLHHLLRRHDLVLRSEAGTWLLVICGQPNDVEKVLGRIDKAWSEANRSAQLPAIPPALAQLHLSVKGTWPLRGRHGEFMACFMDQIRDLQTAPA